MTWVIEPDDSYRFLECLQSPAFFVAIHGCLSFNSILETLRHNVDQACGGEEFRDRA